MKNRCTKWALKLYLFPLASFQTDQHFWPKQMLHLHRYWTWLFFVQVSISLYLVPVIDAQSKIGWFFKCLKKSRLYSWCYESTDFRTGSIPACLQHLASSPTMVVSYCRKLIQFFDVWPTWCCLFHNRGFHIPRTGDVTCHKMVVTCGRGGSRTS